MNPEDELAIRALVARYHDAACRSDAAAWGDTWATDAVWHLGPRSYVGREAIVEYWRDHIQPPYEARIFHVLGQGRVWLEPDGPHGRWTFLDIGRKTHESADHLEACCYVDRYRHDGQRWVFAERRFTLAYRNWLEAGAFTGFPPLD